MKQTVLIGVSMDGRHNYKCLFCCRLDGQKVRTKALKIAVSVKGVESASLKGDEKDQIEVKGDMIDTVELTSLLRKKVGPAHIITVQVERKEEGKKEDKKEEKKEDKKEEKKGPECIAWLYGGGGGGVPYCYSYPIYEVRDCHESYNPCSIM
ncbi:heavy metal-associated isoprenylated plant protein 16-like [Juglans microcarpa x Juglans regia]|uniref:heavy metal-associated isoprenylated plant protein 16-like n=1 Tax=Juglans microcarpa x Juglans regia TaxID=2249226 RepID=UPI001B7E5FB0|nr:heavy metal-associated isoprenylated plant protein 16-like [Juglans microcarpa x Juglans regia]